MKNANVNCFKTLYGQKVSSLCQRKLIDAGRDQCSVSISFSARAFKKA
jgi:hypothetical protein